MIGARGGGEILSLVWVWWGWKKGLYKHVNIIRGIQYFMWNIFLFLWYEEEWASKQDVVQRMCNSCVKD